MFAEMIFALVEAHCVSVSSARRSMEVRKKTILTFYGLFCTMYLTI